MENKKLKHVYLKCHNLSRSKIELLISKSGFAKNEFLNNSDQIEYLALNLKGLWGNYKNPPENKVEISYEEIMKIVAPDIDSEVLKTMPEVLTLEDELKDYNVLTLLHSQYRSINNILIQNDRFDSLIVSAKLKASIPHLTKKEEGLPTVTFSNQTNFTLHVLSDSMNSLTINYLRDASIVLKDHIKQLEEEYLDKWGKLYYNKHF